MGNEAPNWKNLTSPSVAVFLQDYIKSALNTPIQAENDLLFGKTFSAFADLLKHQFKLL
jgi:hypothetical protein